MLAVLQGRVVRVNPFTIDILPSLRPALPHPSVILFLFFWILECPLLRCNLASNSPYSSTRASIEASVGSLQDFFCNICGYGAQESGTKVPDDVITVFFLCVLHKAGSWRGLGHSQRSYDLSWNSVDYYCHDFPRPLVNYKLVGLSFEQWWHAWAANRRLLVISLRRGCRNPCPKDRS